jgi:hypothetical protein
MIKNKKTALFHSKKQEILNFLHTGVSMNDVMNKFFPYLRSGTTEKESRRKLIYQWKSKEEIRKLILGNKNLSKIRPSGVGCVLSFDVECEIAYLIRSLRSEGIRFQMLLSAQKH